MQVLHLLHRPLVRHLHVMSDCRCAAEEPLNSARTQRSLLFTVLLQPLHRQYNCTVCHHLAALLNHGVPDGNRHTAMAFGQRPATVRCCPVGPTYKTRLEDVVLRWAEPQVDCIPACSHPLIISQLAVSCFQFLNDITAVKCTLANGAFQKLLPPCCITCNPKSTPIILAYTNRAGCKAAPCHSGRVSVLSYFQDEHDTLASNNRNSIFFFSFYLYHFLQ